MEYSLTGTCVHWLSVVFIRSELSLFAQGCFDALRAVFLSSGLLSKEKPELVFFYGYPFAIARK